MDYRGTVLLLSIAGVESIDLESLKGTPTKPAVQLDRGVVTPQTNIQFSRSADSTIKLKGSAKR